MDLNASPDEVLVEHARAGNRNAFGVLISRYQALAVMIAQGVLRDAELAKDSSQNAFVKAYFGLKHFKGNARFKTWLVRIVLNEAKDALRKERVRGFFKRVGMMPDDEATEGESILEVIPARGESPREALETVEMKNHLERAIRKLPAREREVFVLRHFNELALQEIAASLGIAIGTVKAHLAHGTEKLRRLLNFEPVPAAGESKGGVSHAG